MWRSVHAVNIFLRSDVVSQLVTNLLSMRQQSCQELRNWEPLGIENHFKLGGKTKKNIWCFEYKAELGCRINIYSTFIYIWKMGTGSSMSKEFETQKYHTPAKITRSVDLTVAVRTTERPLFLTPQTMKLFHSHGTGGLLGVTPAKPEVTQGPLGWWAYCHVFVAGDASKCQTTTGTRHTITDLHFQNT